MHFDHAANAVLFPSATFHISRAEWEYANSSDDISLPEGALGPLCAYRKNFIYEDGQEIYAGPRAYLTPGHTLGSICLVSSDDKGTWAFYGDAIKSRCELKGAGLKKTLNAHMSKDSINKVKKLASRILPGHDC